MSALDNSIYRASMTSRALSTLGDCAVWDAAVQEFLRRYALSQASDEFGPMSKANEAHSRAAMQLQAKYGRGWRTNQEAVDIFAPANAALHIAEDTQSRTYYDPMWAAGRKLAHTKPPTLNAALFKAELIDSEEIWNDTKLGRDAFDIVAEDMARFAGDAA